MADTKYNPGLDGQRAMLEQKLNNSRAQHFDLSTEITIAEAQNPGGPEQTRAHNQRIEDMKRQQKNAKKVIDRLSGEMAQIEAEIRAEQEKQEAEARVAAERAAAEAEASGPELVVDDSEG